MKTVRFFSRVPGSAYVFPDGTKVIFAHGFLDIDETRFPGPVVSPDSQRKLKDDGRPRCEAYAEELNNLANEGNPLIFTQETVKKLQGVGDEYKQEATRAAKSEGEIAKQDQMIRSGNVKGVETGDANTGPVTTGQESTLDMNLQAAMFANRPPVGPGATESKVEQLRRQAQERTLATQAKA